MTAPSSASSGSNDDVDVPASPQSTCTPQHTTSGNIKVAVRLCPIWEDDKGSRKISGGNRDNSIRAWSTEKDGTMVALTQKGCTREVEGRTTFHFDHVFDEEAHTPLVYESIARPMVPAVLNGKHATIFAYGQTGSGKTFTMQGGDKVESESDQAGIIQLVAADLFRFMRKDEVSSKKEFVVKVSYFEIYNEKIRDLLADDEESTSSDSNAFSTSSSNRNDDLTIRTNANGEVIVNVEQKEVNNTEEALAVLVQGNAHRTVAATKMNAHSSRSHSVFRLTVKSRSVDDVSFRVSDFNLVDLAGSESLKSTKSTGIRQREGATINKSLLALTTVIQALSQPTKKRPRHINYRDSKLTRILQPHLSGNAEMAILCCASRSKNFIDETKSTLKFASRAKLIRVKPKINEVMNDGAMIRKLQRQLYEVQKQLELADNKFQEELARKPIAIESSCHGDKDTLHSSNRTGNVVDKRTTNESLVSIPGFQLDAAKSDLARNVQKHHDGRLDSFDPKEFQNSSQDSTADSTSELDRSKSEKRDNQPSLDICDQVSNPETIRGIHGVVDHMGNSVFRSVDSEYLTPNGRLENNLSWDAMASSINSLAQTGQPFQSIQSLDDRGNLIPDEINIIESLMITGNNICLTDHLKNFEAQVQFLGKKLELSDTVIEASSKDLQRARSCIRDLVQRNVEMKVELNKKGREDTKKNYEKGEIIVEQYWILRASLYGSLFFFLSGSQEYFLATAFFVWLALETNVTV